MPDRLTRFKEVLSSLEGSVDIGDLSTRKAWSWLDTHKIEVLELIELKGNAAAEEFLGLPQGKIGGWRTNRGLSDSPGESRRKSMARRKELEACLERLMHDKADVQRQQGRRWLDTHREDMEIALSFGIDHARLISRLGILDGVFRTWRNDRGIIVPRGRVETRIPSPRELAERMLEGLQRNKASIPILDDDLPLWLDQHKVQVLAVLDELGGKAMAEALSISLQVLHDWRRGLVEPSPDDGDRVEPTQARPVRSREELDRELAAANGLAAVEVAVRQVREVVLETRDLLEGVAHAVRR